MRRPEAGLSMRVADWLMWRLFVMWSCCRAGTEWPYRTASLQQPYWQSRPPPYLTVSVARPITLALLPARSSPLTTMR